jgi:histidine triad (HIT) family protein
MSNDYYCDSILSEQVSVEVVAETDRVLAFHHVFRTWEIHIVVIPKSHIRSLTDVEDPSLMAELFQVVIDCARRAGGVTDLARTQRRSDQRSPGVRPVPFAIRASMRGPISSSS